MHLFMGVIKISTGQRARRAQRATRRDRYHDRDREELSRVPLARATASLKTKEGSPIGQRFFCETGLESLGVDGNQEAV